METRDLTFATNLYACGAEAVEEDIEEDEDDVRTKKSKKRGWKEGDNDGDWDGHERAAMKRQKGARDEDVGAAYKSKVRA